MVSTVEAEILRTSMKCSLCNEFLTVPPIVTISKDALQHKCGRCKNVETEISARNVIFEKLAELSTYPCTYAGCKEILKWSEIQEHELDCVYRTVKCPVSWTCSETLNLTNLNAHCLEKHRKNMFEESVLLPFADSLEKSKITVVLLVHDNIQFLVFRVITSENIWIKVFSFLPLENCKYEFDICNATEECCLAYKNPVEFFQERKHCKKCLMNDCDSLLHTKYKKRIDDVLEEYGFQKIVKSMVAQLNLVDLRLRVILDRKSTGASNEIISDKASADTEEEASANGA